MVAVRDYGAFLLDRARWYGDTGIAGKLHIPGFLYDFQAYLVEWALRKGRAAIFADCGLGKTAMQLAWANEIVRHTNKRILLLTPLAVGQQTHNEGEKFHVETFRSRDGKFPESAKIVITNYQQLHKFSTADFVGCVSDESSAIKDFKSATKDAVVEFMRTLPYRLLCTATAAPNDYWELGTSSEALGYLGFRDMITTFFKIENQKDHLGWGRTKYRFRGHAEKPFWSWVCSWAKSLRNPSDIGYSDMGFDLPPLREHEHTVTADKIRDGFLFTLPARNLQEQRQERRNSISERVAMAAEIVSKHAGPTVSWCELNEEGDALTKEIPGSMQVKGSMPDEQKEEILQAFTEGQVTRLVTKPKIGCWGLNWQHCSLTTMFPSHSYEQYYQAIRRFWRFKQESAVDVHLIISSGEEGVLKNIQRKSRQADRMFALIRDHMNDPRAILKVDAFPEREVIPQWVS